jgi:RimJ/RimL family protein N-acetyltransferase
MPNHLFYRKFVTLRNGQEVLLRFLNRADQESFIGLLREFPDPYLSIPTPDLQKMPALPGWPDDINYRRLLPLVALDLQAHRFIASANLHLGRDAARPVGEIRLFVSKPYRNLGLDAIMLRELIDFALEEDLEWLQAEVHAAHNRVIELFRAHGFAVKASLKDHFRRQDGVTQDAVLLIRPLPF